LSSPYDALTLPQILAFVLKEQGGAESLHRLLKELSERGAASREMGIDHADELRLIGLNSVAEIVAEYAENWPSQFDRPCPYPAYDRAGHRDWETRRNKEQKAWEAKRDSALVVRS
jgi:hypothetical protein